MADDDGSNSDSTSGSSSTWKNSRGGKALSAAGRSLSDTGRDMMSNAAEQAARGTGPVSYHRGGKVRKGGEARLLKGERVISRGKVKKVERLMKKSNMRMKAKRSSRG